MNLLSFGRNKGTHSNTHHTPPSKQRSPPSGLGEGPESGPLRLKEEVQTAVGGVPRRPTKAHTAASEVTLPPRQPGVLAADKRDFHPKTGLCFPGEKETCVSWLPGGLTRMNRAVRCDLPSLLGWMCHSPFARWSCPQGSWCFWLAAPLCQHLDLPSTWNASPSCLPSHSQGSLLPLSALFCTLDTRMLLEAFLGQVQGPHESLGFFLHLGTQYRAHRIHPPPAL